MKNKALFPYRLATILLPMFILLLYSIHDNLIIFFTKLPPCPIYSTLHVYCPACGNTRCVIALLHGHLLTALRYNVSPVLFGFFMLLAYIELATYSFGRQIHLLPRNLPFFIVIIVLLLAYLTVRNLFPYLTP